MAYTTLQHLITRYGEAQIIDLSDRSDPPAGEVDETVVTSAIAAADAQIDGYLAGRYQLPLAETPPQIKDASEAITYYRLHRYQVDEKGKDEHTAALKTLREIADGTIRLPIAGVEPKSTGEIGVLTNDRKRPLTEETMKGFT